jgi:hypothetical protein
MLHAECHYGNIQDWIVDHLWYKEKQAKNYPQEIRSVVTLSDKQNTEYSSTSPVLSA